MGRGQFPDDALVVEAVEFEAPEDLTISAVYVAAPTTKANMPGTARGGLHDVKLPCYQPGRFTVLLAHGNMASVRSEVTPRRLLHSAPLTLLWPTLGVAIGRDEPGIARQCAGF